VDLADGVEVIQDQWRAGLSPEEAAAAELVVDLDAEETTCPACLTAFRPDVLSCPGCGLRFG
jgi:hypothetical protein